MLPGGALAPPLVDEAPLHVDQEGRGQVARAVEVETVEGLVLHVEGDASLLAVGVEGGVGVRQGAEALVRHDGRVQPLGTLHLRIGFAAAVGDGRRIAGPARLGALRLTGVRLGGGFTARRRATEAERQHGGADRRWE